MLDNPKQTVDFDEALAERIEHRVASMGADGKLVLDKNGDVYQVNLLEKLLVPLLAKLGNLRQIEVRNGIAYITARADGLFIVDVKDATQPKLLCLPIHHVPWKAALVFDVPMILQAYYL